jgi:rhamnose transport system ATP-binding protein
MSGNVLCELRGVRKAFGGVLALDGVDLELRAGEIHALVGENGAGKSTLIRILTGVLEPDRGEILFSGKPARLHGARSARRLGVAAAHQDPQLFAWRSAAENCFNQRGLPGGLLVSWTAAHDEARRALSALDGHFPPRLPVGLLSASRRQMVALAGALLARPTLLVLDEPTATLSGGEAEKLFGLLRALRSEGKCVLYVSHRLGEVLALADRVTVLRDGRVVRRAASSELDLGGLVEAMVGRRLETFYPRPPDPGPGPAALSVERLTDRRGAFQEVSFEARRGEILGLYGLVGAGRSELGQALSGLRPARGRVKSAGRVAYVPEDRLGEGNLTGLGLRENLAIGSLPALRRGPFIRSGRERALAASLSQKLSIRGPGLEAEIETFSGGNQQKALLARWLATDPEVLVLDEPTQGIDVGAKAEIHRLIAELAAAGKAVVLITSDLPEALGLSHRLAVLREGRIASIFTSREAEESEVGRAAFPLEPARRAGEAGRRAAGWLSRALGQREAAILIAAAAIALATEIKSPGFISAASLRDIAANGAALALASIGETLVIASGAIDISIGSILALSGTAAALFARGGGGPLGALALAVLLGTALGSLNALVSLLGRLHPIITTLGTMGIYRGLFLLWTASEWISLPAPLLSLASEGPLGASWSSWGVGLAAAGVAVFLRWSRLGRACLVLGDNPRAARTHGMPVKRARFVVFAILGGLVGLAAVFHTARFGSVEASTGSGFELRAIAAAVLGGAHVAGGRGTVGGALLGALLIEILADARAVWGIHERWQLVTVGGLMLAALVLERALGRLSRGKPA